MSELPEINGRIRRIINERFDGNVSKFASSIGVVPQKVNRLFNIDGRTGKYPDPNKSDLIVRIENTFTDINSIWLRTGAGEMITMEGKSIDKNFDSIGEIPRRDIIAKENTLYEQFGNSVLMEKPHQKLVTVIPAKSQLGMQGTMFKEDFVGKLPQKVIYTEDTWKGRYFEIECVGDSMTCDDPGKAILEGDEILVRELSRDLYIDNKLHIHDWDEFTFFHYEKDIITKHVLEHDVPGRRVLLHAYNPDKELYPDEWISLNDCYIVGNVISVTHPRGYKRKLKKLNGK